MNFKKRDIILISVLFLLLASPFVYPQVKRSFGVWLQITNAAPIIKMYNASNVSFSVSPTENGATSVFISLNVTDANSVTQINASTLVINFTLGAESGIWRDNISKTSGEFGTCANHTQGISMIINCTILLYYYDNASSSWKINITIQDTLGGTGRNNSEIFTYNTLSALRLPRTFVNFTTGNLGQNDVASSYLVLNNTGNDIFDQINITAAALIGVDTSSETIAATSFYANITNTTAGNGVQLGTSAVTIRDPYSADGTLPNATLYFGHTDSRYSLVADKGNLSMFFWVDIPSSGISAQQYNNTWNVTVINN